MKNETLKTKLFLALVVAATLFLAPVSFAAAPGITGPAFNLTAQTAYLNMPDGEAIYSWGYGCSGAPAGFAPTLTGQNCPSMQVPGPTLIVTEGQTVTVNLSNGLPMAAGNTSILFPGFQVCVGNLTGASATLAGTCTPSTTNPGVTGLLTQEAAPGATVTYSFFAGAPGTHPYYSGTQGDLQIEMGLYGAVIVLPSNVPANCNAGYHALNVTAEGSHGETDFRLAHAAYDHPGSCYDREYLFQWAEMDHRIHTQAETQVQAIATSGYCGSTTPAIAALCRLNVQTEPYHPAYFLINGRSMPDLMDPNFASEYPHQPYNGNPHMHPGELTLIRTIGQGRWEHPFHEHANHVRILSRDGNLELGATAAPCTTTTTTGGCIAYTSGLSGDTTAVSGPPLAGLLMFNTDTTPGESFDGIFYFTGRGLNWDPFGHHPPGSGNGVSQLPITTISEVGNTVTVTYSGLQIPAVGGQVVIAGVTPAGYNGTFTVVSSTNGNPNSTITFTDPTPNLLPGTGGTATMSLGANSFPNDPLASLPCTPDANGYNTGDPTAVNFFEWCQDHNKPVQVNPFGDVAAGGPATLPDPNVFTNGAWYGGTPYFGPDASLRASMPACSTTQNANCTTLLPSNVQANPPSERGWAFMWHSHNEREITTNNVFPGGMLMMMLVDSREFVIDESQ